MMDSKRMKGPWLIKVIRQLPQQLCSLSIPHKNTPTQRKTHKQWTYWQLLWTSIAFWLPPLSIERKDQSTRRNGLPWVRKPRSEPRNLMLLRLNICQSE
jgi:hypothetical protein